MHFVAQKVPNDVGNEKNNLQCERETRSFPEFSSSDPEEDVCYEEGEDSPFDRGIQRADKLVSHSGYCSPATLDTCNVHGA